jgi:hypothetical protein
MAGKSSYIKHVAFIAILGHCGSYGQQNLEQQNLEHYFHFQQNMYFPSPEQ